MNTYVRGSRLIANCALVVIVIVAGAALVGTALNLPDLAGRSATAPGMKVNVAVLLIACACAVSQLPRSSAAVGSFRIAIGAMVSVVALLTLLQDVTGVSLGIDELLAADRWSGTLAPGRMAPTSALCFVFVGGALIASGRGRHLAISHTLAFLDLAVALIVLVGYIFGVMELSAPRPFATMAFNAACCFALLGIAVLAVRPECGLTALLVDPSPAGSNTRRLLPLVVIVPLLVGVVRLEGERRGLYSTAFGLSLMVLTAWILWSRSCGCTAPCWCDRNRASVAR